MPSQPLPLLHLVWQAYGKERQYTVLVNGTRSGDRVHSSPAYMGQSRPPIREFVAHVHHIVEYNKRCTLCFWFIPDTNLPNAPVATEEVIEVFASDLVVEVLDKEDAVGTWRKLCLGVLAKTSGKTMLERHVLSVGEQPLPLQVAVSCKPQLLII